MTLMTDYYIYLSRLFDKIVEKSKYLNGHIEKYKYRRPVLYLKFGKNSHSLCNPSDVIRSMIRGTIF